MYRALEIYFLESFRAQESRDIELELESPLLIRGKSRQLEWHTVSPKGVTSHKKWGTRCTPWHDSCKEGYPSIALVNSLQIACVSAEVLDSKMRFMLTYTLEAYSFHSFRSALSFSSFFLASRYEPRKLSL